MNTSKKFSAKVVAFDIGNVLCYVDIDSFLVTIVKQYPSRWPTILHAYDWLSSIQASQDMGLVNMKQCILTAIPHASESDILTIQQAWLNTVKPCQPMINMVESLISDGTVVCLLSNVGTDHASLLMHMIPEFSDCIRHFSCEVGARKPQALYFQSFFLSHGWTDVPFFDDRPENVEAARMSGFMRPTLFNLNDYENGEMAAQAIIESLKRG
jgi:FMN phosphatase YigB (HAD superfamily)